MDLDAIDTLAGQLAALSSTLEARLAARGFDPSRLQTWAADLNRSADERNRIAGDVRPVPDAMLEKLPSRGEAREALARRGAEALGRGELAVCVLAGGMATRMGGVVKSLLEVVGGHTFLDLRLAELTQIARDHGQAPPLWLMTSEPTDGPIREALAGREVDATTFEQFVSLRLGHDGRLFLEDGEPSVYATGHGDLPDALRRTDMLSRFVAAGGRYVWISNIDNLGAGVDPAVLGQHIESGAPLTVEVADKHPNDTGGGPVLHDGAPIICEHFRLPKSFDPSTVSVFNTNTFLVDARALADLALDWTYVRVEKKVEERPAIQFERLLGEMTVALRPRFAHVSREGEATRFLPVKDYDDLERVRPDAARLARARGLTI
jgi:UTP--glucose-1-phosphate uridylyltransferase